MARKKKIIIIAVILTLFSLLFTAAVLSVDKAAIGPEGTSVGFSKLNGAVSEYLGTNMAWYKITEVIGIIAIMTAAAFACFGVYMLIKGKSLKAVDKKIWFLGGLYAVTMILYVFFEKVIINYRPVIMQGSEYPEASFPSSHTMLAIVIFGSASMLLEYYIRNINLRRILQAVCAIAVAVMICGRLASGVHWVTDIIGSVLISSTLLAYFNAFIDGTD